MGMVRGWCRNGVGMLCVTNVESMFDLTCKLISLHIHLHSTVYCN